MMRYRLSAAAQDDIMGALAWTQRKFGEAARRRYQRLLVWVGPAAVSRPGQVIIVRFRSAG